MKSWVEIREGELPVGEVHQFLAESEGGGVCVFAGNTRRLTGDTVTVMLSYETHNSMALKEMNSLVSRACERWPVFRAVLLHRVGEVAVSESSVIVGVATAHRKESFEACRFLIDELKKSVQIWKKETLDDGSSEWKGERWS